MKIHEFFLLQKISKQNGTLENSYVLPGVPMWGLIACFYFVQSESVQTTDSLRHVGILLNIYKNRQNIYVRRSIATYIHIRFIRDKTRPKLNNT